MSASTWPEVGSKKFSADATAYFKSHAITPAMVEQAGMRYLDPAEVSQVLGTARFSLGDLRGKVPGIAIPAIDGAPGVVRILHADAKPKFVAPENWEPELFFYSKDKRLTCERVKKDASIAIDWTEGPCKGLPLSWHTGNPGFMGNGIDGWGSHRKPIETLKGIALKGRELTIYVDSDAVARPDLRQSIRRLVTYAESRGAQVKLVLIPPGPDGEKRDVNDQLRDGGTKDLPRIETPEDWGAQAATLLLNEKLVFVTNGCADVIKLKEDHDFPGTKTLQLARIQDLRSEFANQFVEVKKTRGDAEVFEKKPVFDIWLTDPYRLEAERIVMRPGEPWGIDPRTRSFNLWSGWAVEPSAPRKGRNWSRLKSHVEEVIAARDKVIATYVLDWMAHGIQYPATLPEVALVLKGGEGTGKGTLAKTLGKLYGRHFAHLDKPGALTDRFNDQVKDKLLVFGDENFFAGDHKAASALKTMITEPTMTVEAKFHDSYVLPNYRKFIIASNENWVVPADADARRYAVFQVSEHRRDDHAYFKALFAELSAGGYGVMLHDLLARDISGFDPRRFPQTQALFEQKLLGFNPVERWWFKCLCRGSNHYKGGADIWNRFLPSGVAIAGVEAEGPDSMERRALETKIGIELKNMCPPAEHQRRMVEGERIYGYALPPLGAARSAFEAYTKSNINWDTKQIRPKGAK